MQADAAHAHRAGVNLRFGLDGKVELVQVSMRMVQVGPGRPCHEAKFADAPGLVTPSGQVTFADRNLLAPQGTTED
jgi:hypothetical protein